MTADEANVLVNEAQDALQEYLADGDMEAAYEICEEYFGLESDYLMELM